MKILSEFREFAVKGNVVEGVTPAPYTTLAAAQEAGAVTLNLGLFLNATVSFPEEPKPEPVPTEKECPFCLQNVLLGATRCPHCTSELEAA